MTRDLDGAVEATRAASSFHGQRLGSKEPSDRRDLRVVAHVEPVAQRQSRIGHEGL
jgi:hypothetical protein